MSWDELVSKLENSSFTKKQVEFALQVCNTLKCVTSPPQVEEGEEGKSLWIRWSKERYYADIDIHVDGSYEWFVVDRESDEQDGSLDIQYGPLTKLFTGWIRRLDYEPLTPSEEDVAKEGGLDRIPKSNQTCSNLK